MTSDNKFIPLYVSIFACVTLVSKDCQKDTVDCVQFLLFFVLVSFVIQLMTQERILELCCYTGDAEKGAM